jgi:hypothetical protein
MKKMIKPSHRLKHSTNWSELYGESNGSLCGISCGLDW